MKKKFTIKDFPYAKKSDYVITRSRFPYSLTSKYSIYDNFNSYCGGGKTKKECKKIINKHVLNSRLVTRELRKQYCKTNKKRK